ncbi:MAG: hypothetical protein V4751_13060 [Pseudomonadota bacterium]
MNKTKLAIAIGALSMAATQATLAAEFTVSGVIDSTYNYSNNSNTLSHVEYGDRYVATITYEADTSSPDYFYTNNYNDYYGYIQSQAEWYNSIQSIEVVVFDSEGGIAHSSLVTVDEAGLTYSHSYAGNYEIDYQQSYGDFEQVYFGIYTQKYDGQTNEQKQVQLYFYSDALNLVLDVNSFPQFPTQADIDSGSLTGQVWNYDYYYNSQTGVYEQWQYGGRIDSLSGEIPTEPDADGDGVPDAEDAFPNDANESVDSDGDGVGNNSDAFPNNPAESTDSDGDGVGNNGDVFPNNASESADTDGDGVGNNADLNDNSDLSATVTIDGNGSNVANTLLTNGLTIADITTAASVDCKVGAKNHGQYTSCVGKTLNSLLAAGSITDAAKGALQSTVAKSSFGKK